MDRVGPENLVFERGYSSSRNLKDKVVMPVREMIKISGGDFFCNEVTFFTFNIFKDQ